MGLFLWILIFQTLALSKCSNLESPNAELTDLRKLFSQLVLKQNQMEKEMKQMRIKNEAMEVQISQLQFAYRQQRRYHYNSNKAVKKQLHKVQQQNNNLRIIISDLQAKQNEPETNIKLHSSVSRTQKLCCEKDIRPIQEPMMKQVLGQTDYWTRKNFVNLKLSTGNGFSDMPLHKNITHSYLDKPNIEDENVGKDKQKRVLPPATSIPNTAKTVVAFQARPSIDIANVGDNQHLEFDRVIFSEGPEYDKTTGTFRCVIPGVYVFSVTILTDPHKFLQVTIVRNGGSLAHLSSYNDNEHGSATNMAIVRLNVGDRVWVRVNAERHSSGSVLNNAFTTFSGFLLNQD